MTDGLGKIYDLIEKAVASVLPDAKEVVDYFNPMLITGVLRVYAEQLSMRK